MGKSGVAMCACALAAALYSVAASAEPRATGAGVDTKVVRDCDHKKASKRFGIRPKRIDFYCTKYRWIEKARYTSYGPRMAAGKGTLGDSESLGRFPATFKLVRPRNCKAAGGPIFTRIKYTFKQRGKKRRGSADFSCKRGSI